MNFWDFAVVLVIAWRILSGWHRGIINEIFRLAAFILGAATALTYGPAVSRTLGGIHIEHPKAALAAAMVVLFLAVTIAVILLGLAVTRIAGVLFLSLPNKALGAGFGVLSGMLLGMLITLMVQWYAPQGVAGYAGRSLTGRIAGGMHRHMMKSIPPAVEKNPPGATRI